MTLPPQDGRSLDRRFEEVNPEVRQKISGTMPSKLL